MKAYARLIPHSNNLKFRRNTLLKFGDSHELIGSAILINPGSASPIMEKDADHEFVSKFFTHNHRLSSPGTISEWKEYSPDPTMGQLEKVFNGWYVNPINSQTRVPKRELNGVIQLFNMFNIMNPNLVEALKQLKVCDSEHTLFSEYTLFANKPVYLGWGNVGQWHMGEASSKIFNGIDLSINKQYKPEVSKNKFYHPGYINRSYKRNQHSMKLLSDFDSLFE